MSAEIHPLSVPDARREVDTLHSASIHHDEVRDFGFADRALALRQRASLTQREVAAHLGVSYKAIGTWEGGLSYPGTERLKQLIALYLERGALTVGREETEAAAMWEAVREAAPRRTVPFDQHWFASLLNAGETVQRGRSVEVTLRHVVPDNGAPVPSMGHGWQGAPDTAAVQGRGKEVATLLGWVRDEHCRLVAILGEAGIGKTILAARLAHDLKGEFGSVYWRSLRHVPAVEEWLSGAIASLSSGHVSVPEGLEPRLDLLLELLRERSRLLVLDGLEAILEPGLPYVQYRAGYESYREVLQQLADTVHQGCVLVTSREQPVREGQLLVRTLRLQGLDMEESRELLGWRGLAGDATDWQTLVARYAGNPLAMQVVGETVSAVFGGDIAAFLAQDVAVFGEVRRLLDEQVGRLSAQERTVLTWLAERPEAVSFAELVSCLGPAADRAAVVEAVEALKRRSLLDPGQRGTYSLQPVVVEYVVSQMTEGSVAATTYRTAECPVASAPAVVAESVRPRNTS